MSDIYDRSPVPDRNPQQRKAAVRAVASMARDALDAALILDALGLDPAEGKQA